MKLHAFLLIFSSYLVFVNGFGTMFWRIRSVIEENRRQRFTLQHQKTQSPNALSLDPVSAVITQPLDHFDPQIKATYNQRYWVNDQFWKPASGPVFLYIGGEGALSESAVFSGAHVKYAKQHNALLFAVEHRFYGLSLNNDGLKLENMKFLSSQQALADLASFHRNVSKSYNLTKNNRWISFGGSYPGALSAWFRIKYPHLVHAAVASSAPVRALVNFDGYCDVVAKSLATEIVGGSQKCLDMVRSAFKTVDEMIQKRNLSQLATDFLSCKPLETDLDVVQAVGNLADVFMGVVQYNDEYDRDFDIKSVCKTMTQGSDAYRNLVTLFKKSLDMSGLRCMDNSWQNFLSLLSNTSFGLSKNMRQWTYQTCSQFGYYQTCDEDDCPFSRYMILSPNFLACESVFNLNTKEVYERVDFTNEYYGSDDPQGSRILFVNGLVDPWHALSVLSNISQSEVAIVIPGAAHCADMHDDSPFDLPVLTEARKRISSQISEWLSDKSREDVQIPRESFTRLRKDTQISAQNL